AGRDPSVLADEVQVVRPVHQQLGHPGVVVVRLGDVAVGALLGAVAAADGVRDVGRESDAAHPLAGDRLLLHVDRLAVLVVPADVYRTTGAGRADAVTGDVAVAGEHVHLVA